MKHMRAMKMIYDKLGEGEMNTLQIKDYLNINTNMGINSRALGNVLAKNKQFVKVGEERVKSISGSTYKVLIWGRV
tara:strand:+ start:8111 stop:8338 length:228 start_codon:yes stop_codon:yes gene_type:complete